MLQEAAAYKSKWQKAQRARLMDDECDKDSFVYVHIRESDNQPFYVGIGFKSDRPWDTYRRSDWHKRIVSKHGIRTEIIIDSITWEQAKFWEVCWIKSLRDSGYDVANHTDGGDGIKGYKFSEDQQEKLTLRSLKGHETRRKKEENLSENELKLIKEMRLKNATHAAAVRLSNITTEELSAATKARWDSPQGEKRKQDLSITLKDHWNSLEGQERKISQGNKFRGEKHPNVKISEHVAQSILDFEGTHSEAAKKFNVTYDIAIDIRRGRSWKHLKPSREA